MPHSKAEIWWVTQLKQSEKNILIQLLYNLDLKEHVDMDDNGNITKLKGGE